MKTAGWAGTKAEVCVWCGADLPESGRRFGRADCDRCGTATTDPVPTAEALDAAYGGWYWPQAGQRFSLIGDALLRRSRASMSKRIDQIAPPGEILDIGAGEGTLIDALMARGRTARGLERDSDHPSIENTSIDQVEGRFAAIVFWHSLEHFGNPRELVREAAQRLVKGGVIVIAVPNYGSRQARRFGDRWLHLDLPRHQVHLTDESLTEGLERSGFRVTELSPTRAGQVVVGWLDGFVSGLPGELDLYQSLRRKSARRIPVTPLQRLAAIGAGIILFPAAVVCAAVEITSKRSGTVYVEAQLA